MKNSLLISRFFTSFSVVFFEVNKQRAIKHLEDAMRFWDVVFDITRPIYNDMPLAAYSYPHEGNRSLIENNRRFHWEKLRPEVARDIEIARHATPNAR